MLIVRSCVIYANGGEIIRDQEQKFLSSNVAKSVSASVYACVCVRVRARAYYFSFNQFLQDPH